MSTAMKKLATYKTPGPDRVTNEIITNLDTEANWILLQFINRTWAQGQLPKSRFTATIIPVHKKGKPPQEPASYRATLTFRYRQAY